MTINWGIIGFGAIADKCTAQAMIDASGSNLVSLMRRNMDKAREYAEKYEVPKYFGTIDEVLNDDEVDAVYIATPIGPHHDQTIWAAEAGKHVLVEKPMAVSVKECQEMIDACEARNVKLMVCFYQRFNGLHQKMKQLLADGLLGRLCAARIQFTQYYPYSLEHWRYDPAQSGGGTVMDTASHCIDTLRFLLGRKVVEVGGFADNFMFNGPVDDTSSMILKFEDGMHAVITSHFSSPDWDQSAVNVVEVYGEKGVMISSPINHKQSGGELRWNVGEGWERYRTEQSTHIALLDAFATCIETDGESPVPGIEGLVNMQIIECLYESSRTGRFVKLT